MTNTPYNHIDEELERTINDAYLYGYDRAKKGLNRRDGYTKDYVADMKALIAQEVEAAQETLINNLLSELPKHKNLAYRQGRSLPVLTGIEQRDPDHVKAKKYINHGFNKALSEAHQIIATLTNNNGGGNEYNNLRVE